ncbi:anaerobic sulfatase maturase [Vibrio porteresiae]|uniref:Anaerobic sulfatase maturase n=1 Tax=Vibrio porteresiae DSM 19223 TaxID=1123496 RepID=A0ABZ0Q7J9_9VIBR|nr:anaerobic sulfatase maturase [Vibrio porteresiae]WPC72370.1 anaerobic sulfatase maturase [Vibrio porteresiae DSM 19223]
MKSINNFQMIAKPSGSVCNIDCTYCFYLEKEKLYPDRKNRWKMDDETLAAYVQKQIQSQKGEVVDFIWQGGEPTLLGIDFFAKALALQEQYKGGKKIQNFFQTNAIKIDDEWVTFLGKHQFLVGVSIDGDREVNDKYRISRSGKSTFDEVLKGIECLKKHKVEFNTLTVVNEFNVRKPLETYQFLKSIGSQFMQFIPLVERKAKEADENGLTLIQPDFTGQCDVTPWSVPSKAYGAFLNKIFDYWVVNDFNRIFVMNFEQTMSQMIGRSAACVFSETCGSDLVMEANGDVYSCDHFVYPEHKLGNLHHHDLEAMVNSPQNLAFGESKKTNISRDCLDCPVKQACNGGCPKHRFQISSDGKPNKNYLCEGFKTHFTHVLPKMVGIFELMEREITPKQIKAAMKKRFY